MRETVTGRYDMLIVSEASDDTALARVTLSLVSRGNVQTETLRAFTENEYRSIIGSICNHSIRVQRQRPRGRRPFLFINVHSRPFAANKAFAFSPSQLLACTPAQPKQPPTRISFTKLFPAL